MNDKTASLQQKRCEKILAIWRPLLGLTEYQINIYFERSYSEENAEEAAKVATRWEYMQAYLYFFLPQVIEHTDQELENVIVHELVHILVNPMSRSDTPREQQEYAVEQLTRALIRVKHNGKKIKV